jgi:hypothetical protein
MDDDEVCLSVPGTALAIQRQPGDTVKNCVALVQLIAEGLIESPFCSTPGI